MPERRIHEIVCRSWPDLRAGRFTAAGRVVELGRLRSIVGAQAAEESPELANGPDEDGGGPCGDAA
jgi:hypothetical protein